MTVLSDHILSTLAEILGPGGLLTGTSETLAYEVGARYDKGKALFVARPKTTKQVSNLMAFCCHHGIRLVPQSGNTGLVSGSTPDTTGAQAILSLDRLNDVHPLDRANRSLHVGAGTRLSTVNEILEKDCLFFPIDLGADPCIGGMVATNTGGTRFVRYGGVRQNILGLKAVLADEKGTIIDFTSPIRKRNVGPDWGQLFIGTSGVYGVVTECVLNVVPKPSQNASALIVPSNLDAVTELLLQLEKRCGSCLTAFEGMSRKAMEAAFAHVPSLSNPFPGGEIPDYAILLELSRDWEAVSGEGVIDAMLEQILADVWENGDDLIADAYLGRSETTWAIRHALSEGVKSLGKLVAFDVSFGRGDVMQFTDYMYRILPERFPDITICDFGHIGDGGLHFNLVIPEGDAAKASSKYEQELRDWVYNIVVNDFKGCFSAEHAIGPKNQPYYDRYIPETHKWVASAVWHALSDAPVGNVRFW